MIDLRSLEAIFWVVKLGGFRRAAEHLHMTQPAVSLRIGQIEARYGVRLLDRARGKATMPTAAGLEVYAHAERMLALGSELDARLSGGTTLSGVVRIGVAETLVHTLLGRVVRLLHDRYPGITPEIAVDISPALRAMLFGGELDIAMLLDPINEPAVRNLALGEYAMAWVASPGLDVGFGELDLAAVARWPILTYARGTQPHGYLSALFARPDLPLVRLFSSSSLASIIDLAADGIGIGVVPRVVAEPHLAAGRLRVLAVAHELPPLRFFASYMAAPANRLTAVVAETAAQVAAGP